MNSKQQFVENLMYTKEERVELKSSEMDDYLQSAKEQKLLPFCNTHVAWLALTSRYIVQFRSRTKKWEIWDMEDERYTPYDESTPLDLLIRMVLTPDEILEVELV